MLPGLRRDSCPTCREWILTYNNYEVLRFLLIVLLLIVALPAQALDVEIGLLDNENKLYVSFDQDYLLLQGPSLEEQYSKHRLEERLKKAPESYPLIAEFKAGSKTLLRSSPEANGDFVVVNEYKNNSRLFTPSGIILLAAKSTAEGVFTIKESKLGAKPGNSYRGMLMLIPHEKSFAAVNKLNIEDYLLSVTASEMPNNWPIEAIKTQAVCARTYTLANLDRRRVLGYDLKANVEDQMYLGTAKENPNTSSAVRGTKNKILLDAHSALANTFYSSTGGRYSSFVENVWGLSPKHYLQAKADFSQGSGFSSWDRKFSLSDLNAKLKDLRLESINGLAILSRSPEGRVSKICLIDSKGSRVSLSGEEFRHKLGLPSTDFSVEVSGGLLIKGRGFGHGIGMSQYGAKNLAAQGLNYEQILAYFYDGTKLKSLLE